MRQRRRQQPLLRNESEHNLQSARKDAVNALFVWVFLEGLSLMILPSFQMIQGPSRYSTWFSLTVPSGVIGAVLMGVSSWWVNWTQEKIDRTVPNKTLYVVLAQAVGWLGLIGIGLPIIVVGIELWLSLMRGPK
jgi:hypothetical protein